MYSEYHSVSESELSLVTNDDSYDSLHSDSDSDSDARGRGAGHWFVWPAKRRAPIKRSRKNAKAILGFGYY